MTDTIFALASAQGRAGVAVVRISGPAACAVVRDLTGKELVARRALYAPLLSDGQVIDQAVVLWFQAPASFTGEDCVELQVHGSKAVLNRLYEVLSRAGLRLAGPGEFSRRAVINGKLDLTQAEGIADLVDAETEAQRRQALTQLDGGLKRQYEAWRADLVEILARLEVYIDFPDEDLPQDLVDAIQSRLAAFEASLRAAMGEAERGRQIREGYRIVILGRPNAGKSSLFNTLLQSEAAIVTPVAGTTRDVIEARLRAGPYSVLLYDTAGLRESDEAIEAEGIRRARLKAAEADLRIWVLDAGDKVLDDEVRAGDLVVVNKADVYPEALVSGDHFVSTRSGLGIEGLRADIEGRVEAQLAGQTFPAATRQRHMERLAACLGDIGLARDSGVKVPELTAEHVRSAIGAFDALFGRYDVEEVLDVVFSTFCIGK